MLADGFAITVICTALPGKLRESANINNLTVLTVSLQLCDVNGYIEGIHLVIVGDGNIVGGITEGGGQLVNADIIRRLTGACRNAA